MIRISTNLESYIVLPGEKIESIIERIKEHQILFICDQHMTLLGCISIGDLRRHITKTHLTVIEIANTTPFVFDTEADISALNESLIHILQKNGLSAIPRVSNSNKLIEIIEFSKFEKETLDEHLVIMAGGKGTRMLPLTNEIPKPMALVKGKPIIQHIIDKAKLEGFRKFIISIGYLGHIIQNHFESLKDSEIEIIIIKEGKPLGTAGALGLLKDEKLSESFVVTNGDIVSAISYRKLLEYHKQQSAHATMVVKEHLIKNPFGVIITNGEKITGIEEKPINKTLINAGVYCFKKDIISLIDENVHLDMTTLFEKLIGKNFNCNIYGLFEEWNDIADLSQLNKINQ